MLDVCCYTGGFGIYAKNLGGAEDVTGVDLDEEAIELANKNANLNELRIQHVHADAFGYLRQMQTNGRTYDVVVLDPPKFVANRDEYDEGSRKYVDLNTLGMTVLRPGGLLPPARARAWSRARLPRHRQVRRQPPAPPAADRRSDRRRPGSPGHGQLPRE